MTENDYVFAWYWSPVFANVDNDLIGTAQAMAAISAISLVTIFALPVDRIRALSWLCAALIVMLGAEFLTLAIAVMLYGADLCILDAKRKKEAKKAERIKKGRKI